MMVQVPFSGPPRSDPRGQGKPLRHKASRHSTDPGEVMNVFVDHSSGSEEGSIIFTDYDSDSTRPTSHNGSDKLPSRHRRKSSHNQVRPATGRRHSVRDSSFRDHRDHREHRRRGSHSRRHSRDDDELSEEVDLRPRGGTRRRSSVYESDHRFPSSVEETRLVDPRRRPLAGSDYGVSPRSRTLSELGAHDDYELDRVRSRLRQEDALLLEEEAILRREDARREDAMLREAIRREDALRREEALRRHALRIEDRLGREEAIRAADSMRRDNALRREGSLRREEGFRGGLLRTSTEPTLSRGGYSPPLSRVTSRYY